MQHSSTFIKDVAEELSQKLQNLSAKVTTKREQIHGVNIHREKQKEQQKLATCKQETNKIFLRSHCKPTGMHQATQSCSPSRIN